MARTKTHRLKNVVLNEVSLVGKGDNPGAHVLLLKTRKEEIRDFEKEYDGDNKNTLLKQWYNDNVSTILKDSSCNAETFDEIVQDKELRDKIWDMIWTLQDSISSIVNDDEVADKEALTNTTVGQFQQAVSALFKGGSTEMAKKTVEELEKALTEEQAKTADLTKQLEEVTKAAKEPNEDGSCKSCGHVAKTEEAIDKSALPEAVRKHLEAQEAINKENAAEITKLRDESVTKICVEKAKAVPAVGDVESISGLLKEIGKLDSALSDKVYSIFKIAHARIKESGLFKEAGSDGEGVVKTAAEQLDVLAKAHAAEKGVSYAVAYDFVYANNHDLRKAYNEER